MSGWSRAHVGWFWKQQKSSIKRWFLTNPSKWLSFHFVDQRIASVPLFGNVYPRQSGWVQTCWWMRFETRRRAKNNPRQTCRQGRNNLTTPEDISGIQRWQKWINHHLQKETAKQFQINRRPSPSSHTSEDSRKFCVCKKKCSFFCFLQETLRHEPLRNTQKNGHVAPQ